MSNRYQQELLLASPLLFYVIFFRSFPCLLGKIVTKYATNDFDGTILLCAYYILVSLLLVGYLLKQNSRTFFKVKFHSHYVGAIVLLALTNLAFSAVLLCYLPIPLNQELLNENRIISAENVLLVRFSRGGIVALTNEELFYRGVFMSAYSRRSRYHLDILVSAICFASVHTIWSSWLWSDFIQYILAGLPLGLIFKWTKFTYYPILLHLLVDYGPKTILMTLT